MFFSSEYKSHNQKQPIYNLYKKYIIFATAFALCLCKGRKKGIKYGKMCYLHTASILWEAEKRIYVLSRYGEPLQRRLADTGRDYKKERILGGIKNAQKSFHRYVSRTHAQGT